MKESKPDQGQSSSSIDGGTHLSRRQVLKASLASAITLAAPIGHTAHAAVLREPGQADSMPPLPVDKVQPSVPSKVLDFDVADVRLLPGPFLDAQSRDGAYLLSLEPDRFLHNFLLNAGLDPKGAIYGGWENTDLAGHCVGHYLSACAMMYRATGDMRYRQRCEYMTAELARCQAKSTDGLVCAIPKADVVFQKIAVDGTVTGWVPWYNIHKLLAGLRDIYRYCGDANARRVFLTLTSWAMSLTKNLSDDQFQHMLDTEHGGMAETIADAYAMTADDRYLAFARRFTHHAVFDPLAAGQDRLDGLHSNTNIPKMIGYERVSELTADRAYHAAPSFFWQTVTETRTYANGGNGDYEHFFPVNEFGQHANSDCATETCCTYNMLKLTKQLFMQDPSPAFAEYYERAVLNHILASQEEHGLMIYFTPMKPGHFKTYGDPVNAFWCCTGTGMENHARYGESIYFHSDDKQTLYVNQFISSTLHWREAGVTLRQETRFPVNNEVQIKIDCEHPRTFTLNLRYPSWATHATVTVNGKAVEAASKAGGYVVVRRTWKSGDTVHMALGMALRAEPLPNDSGKQAFLYGPVLLAGALGTDGMSPGMDVNGSQAPYDNQPAVDVPVLVAESGQLLNGVKPAVSESALTFRTDGLGQPNDVTLIPHLSPEPSTLYLSIL